MPTAKPNSLLILRISTQADTQPAKKMIQQELRLPLVSTPMLSSRKRLKPELVIRVMTKRRTITLRCLMRREMNSKKPSRSKPRKMIPHLLLLGSKITHQVREKKVSVAHQKRMKVMVVWNW